MMTSTDEIPRSGPRPWSQLLVERLSPDERGALGFLEQHDRQDGGCASVPILVGQALNLLEDRATYTKLGLENMEQVCQAFRSIGARHGRDYQRAARLFSLEEVGNTRHSLAGLLDIGEAPKAYRQALLEQGSGRPVVDLREARQAAEACATEEEGLAALAEKLAQKRTPLEVELRRIGSAGPYMSRRVRRLMDLVVEGQELDEERRLDLAGKLESLQAELSGLVEVLRRPPDPPAAAEADDRAAETDDRADAANDRAAETDDRADTANDRTADTDDRTDLRGCECAFVKTSSPESVESELRPRQTTPGPPKKPTWTSELPEDVAPLAPVMAALRRGLPASAQSALAGSLRSVVMGDSPQQPADALRGLFAQCAWGGEPPQAQLDSLHRRLRQPVYEDRARFAVRCLFITGTQEARDSLTRLLAEKLPVSVMVEVVWWEGQDSPDTG